jgi:hypothetical protein
MPAGLTALACSRPGGGSGSGPTAPQAGRRQRQRTDSAAGWAAAAAEMYADKPYAQHAPYQRLRKQCE